MIEGVTWEGMAMVIGIAALAAGSITEIVKKAIQQGIIERLSGGKPKPWWRGTVLRLVSAVSGMAFGWFMMPENPRLGLILGIGSGSVTSEAIGLVKRTLRRRNGSGGTAEPTKERSGRRVESTTDFAPPGGETEFHQEAIEEDPG